jgi:hypothetical protein
MADFYESLAHEQIEFIEPQQPFFNASAQDTHRANLSPKEMGAFRVFDSTLIACLDRILDRIVSGHETCAQIENGRRPAQTEAEHEKHGVGHLVRHLFDSND